MSDTTTTTTVGDTIRSDVFLAIANVNYDASLSSDGSTSPTATAAGSFLTIDTVGGAAAPAADLFLGGGFSLVENVNDLSPVIATAADTVAGQLDYQGDSGGQTFFAGSGVENVAFVGFGNTFAAPSAGTGTYEISAGLASPTQLETLATAVASTVAGATGNLGNTIVAASGNASIAAGLGDNTIFLGTGTALVANEGNDVIQGGTGAATVDGVYDSVAGISGAATVYAGTGSVTYNGAGGTALVLGSTDSTSSATSAVNVYGGSGSVTVYGGSGDEQAFGGSGGNNVLVSGSGNSSLVGGGNNDLLVASGTGTTSLVAGQGNETLFGGGASGTTNFFLGAGSDTVVAGTGSEYLQFGTGTSTVFGGGGSDLYGVVNGQGGGTNLVVGFDASKDFISLQGFDSTTTGASVLANDTSTIDGSSFINLSDGTSIELYGVTNLTAGNFT